MTAALLDVDGTLVDTNYHHAIAWHRAFRVHGVELPVWRIHRRIGMGGDQIIADLAGDEVEAERGDDIRDAEGERYAELISEVRPLEGARELIDDLRRAGRTVILSSSAKQEEVDHYLDLLGGREVVDDWTTSADVEATKPAPDLIEAGLAKAGSRDAVMVGDSTWDVIAAKRAGIETVAVLTGGFAVEELREAGAAIVFESVAELRERLAETPLGG
jgi:HAD superfamily hydrolase (TIGR01509 family)